MKTSQIRNIINTLGNLSKITDNFSYFGYELPKQKTKGNLLILSDLDEGGGCINPQLLEVKIIGSIDTSALKVKSLVEVVDEVIMGHFKMGFSHIFKFDESPPILNSHGRYEKVITYQMY